MADIAAAPAARRVVTPRLAATLLVSLLLFGILVRLAAPGRVNCAPPRSSSAPC